MNKCNMNSTEALFELNNDTEMTSQHDSFSHKLHAAIITVATLVICCLLFGNTCIVVCFIVNRKKTWPTFVAQIFCLSLSDLFVGLSFIPWVILPVAKSEGVTVPYVWCSAMLYMTVCSQCGSLYHILSICAHRCLKIETSSRLNNSQSFRRAPFVFALLAWSASLVKSSLPFLFWTNTEGEIYSCLLQEIFIDLKSAIGVIGLILFIPQLLTNVLYLVACLRLRCITPRIFPAQSMPSAERHSNSNNINQTTYSGNILRIQWRFLGTIGIVMLLFNICTLPVIFLTFFENKFYMLDREYRYAAVTFFLLNSALNPFIYAFRSTWLKKALKRLITNIG